MQYRRRDTVNTEQVGAYDYSRLAAAPLRLTDGWVEADIAVIAGLAPCVCISMQRSRT